jgi:hypothetical protein
MASVTLHLAQDMEQKLREKASRKGQTLEAYLEQLAQEEAQAGNGTAPIATAEAPLSDEEFDRLLDELSEGPALPHLPADFSRADIYADHD